MVTTQGQATHFLRKIQRVQPDTSAAFEAGQNLGAIIALGIQEFVDGVDLDEFSGDLKL